MDWQQDANYIKAKNYALNLLSYRPRSCHEIEAKLKQRDYQQEIIQAVMEFLREYNFINDMDFAKRWVNQRCCSKPMGRRRLKQELYQKGIEQEVVDQAIHDYSPEDEFTMALALGEKRFNRKPTLQGLEKVKGFLLRRGFSHQIINGVCNVLSRHNLDS